MIKGGLFDTDTSSIDRPWHSWFQFPLRLEHTEAEEVDGSDDRFNEDHSPNNIAPNDSVLDVGVFVVLFIEESVGLEGMAVLLSHLTFPLM